MYHSYILKQQDLQPRTVLLLQDTSKLTEQEIWLYKSYKNLITKIFEKTTLKHSSIDPFAGQYYGKGSVKLDPNYYDSFLEITSHFWSSKGGRGKILQKMFKHFAGKTAEEDSYLSLFLEKLVDNNQFLNGKISSKFKTKVDLLNIQDKKIVLVEIKNRVDSGGTSSRNEVLKKFFELFDSIIDDTIALTDSKTGQEYTLSKLLAKLDITRFEVVMGFLYNKKSNIASLDDDKSDGFYSTSKKLIRDYASHHPGLLHDLELLKITMRKDGVEFVIETVYGDDIVRRFIDDKYVLDDLTNSMFEKSWDDIWLALTLGISETTVLRI